MGPHVRLVSITCIILVAASLVGCSTTYGTKITQAELQGFTAGRTTYSEVIGRLGKPGGESRDVGRGTTTVKYQSAYSPSPLSTLGIGGKYQLTTSLFVFDGKGILQEIKYHDGDLASYSMGL